MNTKAGATILAWLGGGAEQAKRPLRVVIFEDNPDTVLSLTMLLDAEGYEVKAFTNGQYGLTKVSAFKPDVVLIDIGLPDVNGYDLARTLRNVLANECPLLIAVTAYSRAGDREIAIQAGFDQHVGKPYDPAVLLSLIAEAAPL